MPLPQQSLFSCIPLLEIGNTVSSKSVIDHIEKNSQLIGEVAGSQATTLKFFNSKFPALQKIAFHNGIAKNCLLAHYTSPPCQKISYRHTLFYIPGLL